MTDFLVVFSVLTHGEDFNFNKSINYILLSVDPLSPLN